MTETPYLQSLGKARTFSPVSYSHFHFSHLLLQRVIEFDAFSWIIHSNCYSFHWCFVFYFECSRNLLSQQTEKLPYCLFGSTQVTKAKVSSYWLFWIIEYLRKISHIRYIYSTSVNKCKNLCITITDHHIILGAFTNHGCVVITTHLCSLGIH